MVPLSADGDMATVGERLDTATAADGQQYSVGEFVYLTNTRNAADPPHIGLLEQLWMQGDDLYFRFVHK